MRRSISSRVGLCLVVCLFVAVAGLTVLSADAANRPENWAQALEGHEGLSNLFKVSGHLYRGAQPEKEGFAELKKMGVNTVVNLRTFHSDRRNCRKNGLNYVHITVQTWEVEDEEVVEFLRTVTDAGNQPVFVHCQHGADRTGVMVAAYRLAVQGWSKQDAIAEMTEGGFGFHSIWKNLVTYVEHLDVAKIRRLAGIAEK